VALCRTRPEDTSSAASSAASTVTAPTVGVTTENFTGSVDVASTDFHPFTVALSGGQVTVNLAQAGPPATIFMGLGVGTVSGTTCTLLTNGFVVAPASTTAQLSGTLNAGSYCVMVYDAGNQTTPITYSVVVNHF
jgi:hypothetical protein